MSGCIEGREKCTERNKNEFLSGLLRMDAGRKGFFILKNRLRIHLIHSRI